MVSEDSHITEAKRRHVTSLPVHPRHYSIHVCVSSASETTGSSFQSSNWQESHLSKHTHCLKMFPFLLPTLFCYFHLFLRSLYIITWGSWTGFLLSSTLIQSLNWQSSFNSRVTCDHPFPHHHPNHLPAAPTQVSEPPVPFIRLSGIASASSLPDLSTFWKTARHTLTNQFILSSKTSSNL